MTLRVEFRPAALYDLQRIYLAVYEAAGPDRAGDYVDRIEAACMRLSTFAERGTERSHIYPGLRVIGFERRASIAFIVREDSVQILRILPKGMNFPKGWEDTDERL